MTLQPACTRKISALRRIVFESSITITLTPARFAVSLTLFTPATSSVRYSDSVVGLSLAVACLRLLKVFILYSQIHPKQSLVWRISEAPSGSPLGLDRYAWSCREA